MRVLLTNDDGVGASGLLALEKVLQIKHEVWTVAPDRERSGQSHAINLRGPLKISQKSSKVFSCDGTPADCVLMAHKGTFVPPFDVVLSGINRGPNLGTDVIYSGTAAGARQASFLGLPGIAVSLDVLTGPWNYEPGADFIAENLAALINLWKPGFYLNINVPAFPVLPLKSEIAFPCVRRYDDHVVEFKAPDGNIFCWVQGEINDQTVPTGSDWEIVKRGKVAVSLLYSQPVAFKDPEASP